MIPSAVPAVTDHVLFLIGQSEALADVQVVDGLGSRDLEFTHIAVGDVESGTWQREFVHLGRGRIEESFAILFWIRVLTPGLSQKEARDWAFELLAGVDDLGINNQTLSQAVLTVVSSAVKVRDFLELPKANEGGNEAYITGAIECSTWIEPES